MEEACEKYLYANPTRNKNNDQKIMQLRSCLPNLKREQLLHNDQFLSGIVTVLALFWESSWRYHVTPSHSRLIEQPYEDAALLILKAVKIIG